MYKLFLPFLLLSSVYLSGQVHSKELSSTSKLALTCKVWGLLKYYHPVVAKEDTGWDDQLFQKIPQILETKSEVEFFDLIDNWINDFGDITSRKQIVNKDQKTNLFEANINLDWIDSLKNKRPFLFEKLKSVKEHRVKGKRYYVKKGSVNQVEIINERSIKQSDWNSLNHRLLVLFRYWNIVEHFFPYKYQMDIPWDKTLIDMIPKFKKANTELAFHLAINELVVRLDDSHAGFSSKILREHFGNYHTPYLHRFVDQNYVVTNYYNDSLAKLNGLQTGDIIKKVDGKKPWDIFQKRLKYISGSNLPRKKIASWIMITSGKNESVELELLRGNKRFTKKISRYLSDDMGYSPKKRILPEIDSSISYMFIKQLNNKRLNALKDGLENKKAWILDLRTYPKYSSGPTFANVLSKKEKVFCKVIKPDFDYPSRFYEYTLPSVGRNSGLKYNGKVFLLVNSYTQSAAEFQAMQIQTGENVTTIGSQTSGADGNVTRFEILENLKTAFSGIGIFYPDGTETQRKGVRIDIQVPITIDGIRTGRDEVLEKAIELANKL